MTGTPGGTNQPTHPMELIGGIVFALFFAALCVLVIGGALGRDV